MARVRVFNTEFYADPVEQTAAGDWLMRSRAHTARTTPGTLFLAKQSEIIEMAAAEMPGNAPIPADLVNHAGSLDALEGGMAIELKTLVPASELIAQHRQDLAEVKTETPDPNPAPQGAAANSGTQTMTHLADKMKMLAQGTSSFSSKLEKKIDDALAAHQSKQQDILDRAEKAFGTVESINADAEAGLNAIESELKNLTNQ